MRKILQKIKNSKMQKSKLFKVIILSLLAISFSALFIFEAQAGWKFWEKRGICEKLVEPIIKKPLIVTLLTKSGEDMDCIKKKCYELILKDGDYKELYAYYQLYKYADKVLQEARNGKDETPNNIYHYMLFYANQNSREFNPKTNSFKKEQGLYEQELKDFEDAMTQEEKIKAFSYIADNLAFGKEGWVKVNDYEKSFEYLKKAAEAGDRFSQAELGACYFGGGDRFYKFEFPKSYVEAYAWTYLSTTHSEQKSSQYEMSKKMLKIISSAASKQEINESKQQIETWLKNNKIFINRYPLKIIKTSKREEENDKKKTQEIIKKYNMFPSNLTNN
jgi:TPR repeat protein